MPTFARLRRFVFLIGLLIAATERLAATASDEEESVVALVAEARAVLESDLETWAEHAFERRVSRERLDKQGIVVWRETYRFAVRPTAAGFDEHLLSINGRPPRPREVENHRVAGRFAKHYRAARAARLRNPFGQDLPLQPLLFNQDHRLVGRDEVAGIECRRIAFEARPEPDEPSVALRLERAARGSLCLSVEGTHVVEAEIESVRPVGQAPLRLERLELRFSSRSEGGVWLPRLFETASEFKLLLRTRRTRNRYEYSAYHRPD